MKNLVKVILICLLSFLFTSTVQASDFNLIEKFNSGTGLDRFDNDGNIVYENNQLVFTSNSPFKYPYIVNSTKLSDLGTVSTISGEVNLSGFTNFGYGVIFSDQKLLNGRTSDLTWSELILFIWPDAGGATFSVSTSLCQESQAACVDGTAQNIIWSGDSTESVKFDITKDSSDKFTILTNGSSFVSKPSQRKIEYLMYGNPQLTGSVTYGHLTVKNTLVTFTNSESKTKVVVVPGLGASWNKNALLLGQTGGTWTLPSFVKTYDRFFSSLESSGLVKDTDYFVFAYDWRKSISDLAVDLDTYINGLRASGKLAANEKITLVGHSMGGLVARQYVQNSGPSSIEKLITVATPNQGLVDAYGIWQGAKVWSGLWWQKAFLALNIVNSKAPGELAVDTVRRTFPGAKDLLPTYDYILKDSVVPESSMINRNLYLAKLNVDSATNSGVLTSVAGTGFSTKAMVKTIDRTAEEAALKMWEDGKPNPSSPFESSPDGDGALIVESALGAVENKVLYTFANHGGVMSSDDSLSKLLGEIVDTPVLSGAETNENSTSSLVLFLKSPGRLSVCMGTVCNTDLGIYSEIDKTFFIPNYSNANLSVQVISEGDSGNYTLGSVEILNNGDVVSDTVSGNLSMGGTNQHEYTTNVGFEDNEDEPTTEEWLAGEVQALVSVIGGKWDGQKLTTLLLKERREIERIHLIRLIEDISLLGVKLNAKKSPAKSQAFWRFTLALDKYSTLVIDEGNLYKHQVENQIKITEKELVKAEKIATKKGGWALTFYQNSQRLITQAKESINTSTNLASQQAWLAMRLIQMIYLM